jgi:hypothetical protein
MEVLICCATGVYHYFLETLRKSNKNRSKNKNTPSSVLLPRLDPARKFNLRQILQSEESQALRLVVVRGNRSLTCHPLKNKHFLEKLDKIRLCGIFIGF